MLDLESLAHFFNEQTNEIARWWWWYVKEISWQLVAGVIAYFLVSGILYALMKRVNHRAWHLPGPPSRILLVTAHPDDEIMFFGPMLYSLVNFTNIKIYLLCFTIGTFLTLFLTQ